MKPIIIAITGPSCAGKDTLMRQLYTEFYQWDMIERFPHVYYIVSSTTRPPRVNEIDNKDYHFITNKEFLNKIIHNEMLEWTQFRNWKYGTDKHSVSHKPGAINIGVFNLQGIKSLEQQDEFEIIPIYLRVHWRERLRRSIKREGQLTFEMIRRLITDYKDFKNPWKILCQNNNLLIYSQNYNIDDVMRDLLGKIELYK